MPISHDIIRLQAEVDLLKRRMAAGAAPQGNAAPAARAAAPDGETPAPHGPTLELLQTIEHLIEDSVQEIEQHPKAAVIAAFGLGFALGLVSAR